MAWLASTPLGDGSQSGIDLWLGTTTNPENDEGVHAKESEDVRLRLDLGRQDPSHERDGKLPLIHHYFIRMDFSPYKADLSNWQGLPTRH